MTNFFFRHHQSANGKSDTAFFLPSNFQPVFAEQPSITKQPSFHQLTRYQTYNQNDDEYEHDVDLAVLTEAEPKEPPMYAVVMFNDDYTPMEFVVAVLISEFRHSEEQAVQIMLSIHTSGKGIAGIYAKDIAETKAKKVNGLARREGYPLLTQIEPSQAN